MFSIEIYKLNRNGTERTSGKAGVGDGGRAPRPADALLVVRWAGRCGERTERCQWQRKRSERVAAVKILSVRRKAAQKFWAPQQDHRPLRRFDKKVPAWDPPVTALPCQGPLARGPLGTGDADCHNQRARWFRNDILQEARWSVAHMGAALQGFCRAGPACPAVGAGKIRFGPM